MLVVHVILYLCRAKKTRESDSLSQLIHENFKSGKRLDIDPISVDSHSEMGRMMFGRYGDLEDGREEERLDRWFNINSVITNKAYEDPWEEEIKKIWYERTKKARERKEK